MTWTCALKCAWAGLMCAQLAPAWALDAGKLDYGLKLRQIAAHTYVMEGAVADFSRSNGCNIINTGVISTPEGTLVINTGVSRLYGEQQRTAMARVQASPVRQVVSLNLHPDYFLGNQAWADVPTLALSGTRAGMQAEGQAYESNLYRLCGDWMKGTSAQPARQDLVPGRIQWGGHDLEWRRLSGHTDDDLVLIDHSTGVLFAGGLVFADRVPTTPHARLPEWINSLKTLREWVARGEVRTVVPSHGPVHTGTRGIDQTLDWLQWLALRLEASATQGLDLSEVLRLPLPERFASWAAQPAEYVRSVMGLYPAHELAQLPERSAPTGTAR